MKILHIIPTYTPARFASGPINATHDLNKWLSQKGVDITVYTTNADKPNDKINVPVNREVNIDGVKVFYFQTSFPRFWYYSSALRKKLKESIQKFDLIHISSVFLSASTLGAYYAKKFKKPYIISFFGTLMKVPMSHGTLKKKIYLNLIEKRNLRGASVIHFTSEKEKKDYELFNLPKNKKKIVIFSGIDPNVFKPNIDPKFFREKFNIPVGDKVILFLGRLSWIKGIDTLIPAFGEVLKKNPQTTLVLAGQDADYNKEIGQLIFESNVGDKVITPGPIFGDEKAAALSQSDIFVLSSYSEAGSLAVIEALLYGIPTVITENCGMSHEIGRAGAGIVVKKNIEDLSEALIRILNDDNLAGEMKKRARVFAENELVFSKIVDKYIKLYEEVINDHKENNKYRT